MNDPLVYPGFSNGAEHEVFLEQWCYRCKKFVCWETRKPGEQICPIEDQMSITSITGENFPSTYIKMAPKKGPYCTEFEKEE